MKKSLIALAVAGVFAAPVYAATANVEVYGIASFSVDHVDTNEALGDSSDLVTGRDNVSRIGVKGSEDLGGGMKAVYQAEMQLNADFAGTGASGQFNQGGAAGVAVPAGGPAWRNTFVGLSGDFGTVVLGRHDTPYKLGTGKLDPFADTIGDYNAIVGRTTAGNIFDIRAPQTIAYISPTFSGFHGAVAYVSVKANENPALPAISTEDSTAWSLTGIYDNGPIFGSLSYEQHNGSVGMGAVQAAGAVPADSIDAWKLGAGYTFGDTKLGLVYEDISGGDTNGATAFGKSNDRKAWYLSGSHAMGPIVLKAAYGKADDSDNVLNANDGATFWSLGADYNLSKRTSVYAVYAKQNNDGDLRATALVGGGGMGYGLNNYAFTTSTTAPNTWSNDITAFSLGVKHSF